MIIYFGYLNNLLGTVFSACVLAAVMGNLNSWTSPVIPKLNGTTSDNPFSEVITEAQVSWMSSLLTLGAVAGCWIFGGLSDAIGRRFVFISLGVPILLGYVLMIAFPRVEVFYVARFLQGLSMGGGFNMFLAYVGEICSKETRGVAMTLTGMINSAGTLICYGIGPYVSVTIFNVILMFLPIAYLASSIIFAEESPYFYLMKNKEEQARKSLRIYRGPHYNFEEDIVEMKAQIKKQQEGNIKDIIKTRGYLKAFIIANVLLIGQQFTGINGILMYSQTIFNLTGSSLTPEVCSLILAAMQLISGILPPLMANRFGKIPILLTSGAGMIISEIILGIYCILQEEGRDLAAINFIPIICLTTFMLSYNYGFGPLCWVIAGEVYPTRVKILSMSFSISIYFGIGFFIAQYFNNVVSAIGIGALFFIFAGCCVCTCFFVKFYVVETKGITLEEIQDILNGKKAKNFEINGNSIQQSDAEKIERY